MKLYIAGQITGLRIETAKLIFRNAEKELAHLGYESINPLETVSEQEGKTWAEYMAEDFLLLDQCDGIYMLSNWRNSKGARIEHAIAEITGKQIFYEATDF